MTEIPDHQTSRAVALDRALRDLLGQTPELEAAAVVSFDGLPMASALPVTMDEERVAAMSAALLSLGEQAAAGLGRGALTQVYVEGEAGTVFLVSAEDEAVLVAVASRGAKTGLVLFEARRTARAVADILRLDDEAAHAADVRAPARDVADDIAATEDSTAAAVAVAVGVPAQATAPRPVATNVSALRPGRAEIPLEPVQPDGWAAWGAQNTSPGSADSGAASPTTPW